MGTSPFQCPNSRESTANRSNRRWARDADEERLAITVAQRMRELATLRTLGASRRQVLQILYALLGLSVIVSLFGVINTLVLSVFARTRELGMVRAIGMTRRQVRRMIRARASSPR
jgi:ABC-type antimicrobial peptide transport system permease subunit